MTTRRSAPLLLATTLALFCPLAAAVEAVSREVYDALQQVSTLVARTELTAAIAALRKLQDTTSVGSYERAVVLRTLASVHAKQGAYGQAAKVLGESLAYGSLSALEAARARQDLASLQAAAGNPAGIVAALQPLLQSGEPLPARVRILLANAYAELGRLRQAVREVRAAIGDDNPPEESWSRLLVGLYAELKQYGAAIAVLTELLRRSPDNAAYWRDLYGLELRRGRYDRAAAALSLAQRLGLLRSERDILQLADVYRLAGLPYQAGVLLEQAMSAGKLGRSPAHWALAADAWLQAQETDRALQALDQALATPGLAAEGRPLQVRLGGLLVQRGRWQEAVTLLERASGQVAGQERGRVYLLLGIAYAEQQADAPARQALLEARRHPGSRETAQRWLSYLDTVSRFRADVGTAASDLPAAQ